MADTPIKYIVKEKSLIGNELFEAGAEVELPEGTWPGPNMEPTCERGTARQAEYNDVILPKMRKDLQARYGQDSGMTGDMAALSKAISAAVAEAIASQKDETAALQARIAELEAAADKPAKKAKSADLA